MDEIEQDPHLELTSLIRRYMRITNIDRDSGQTKYTAAFHGQLLGDSEQAFDQLTELLKPYGLMPLFRNDQTQHVILVVPTQAKPRPNKLRWNVVMFILTVFSVWLTGSLINNIYEKPNGIVQTVVGGLPFAVALLAILLAHEFGHYLMGRRRGVLVSLPYFIPFPLSPFGTMGAVIQMKEIPKNKRTLMDIGLAGPLSGLLVAVPVLLLGLWLSKVAPVSTADLQPGMGFTMEGNSLLYLGAKFLVFGKLLPAPVDFNGLSPFMYWVRYFFSATPFPEGGIDVMLHPVAWAGWAGLLVTALNLIPAGQLDGGHLVYVLLGRERARMVLPFVLVALGFMGLAWSGWWLWAGLIFFFGRIYAEPLDAITPIDAPHKFMAVVGIIIFVLVFIPVPLSVVYR